jgi:hypothetical protein
MNYKICIDRSDATKRLYVQYDNAYEVFHKQYEPGLEKKSYMWFMEHGGALYCWEDVFNIHYTLYEQVSLFENELEMKQDEK